jgi:osmotically-inducible protein OsmY
LGVLVAVMFIWLVPDGNVREEVKDTGREIGDKMQEAGDEIKDAVEDFDKTEVGRNLKNAGSNVVEKTRETFADASITTAIKTKMAADPTVSALAIDVDTSDSVVTLSGKVSSVEELKQAVSLASAVEGVKEVHSTLQVRMSPKVPES